MSRFSGQVLDQYDDLTGSVLRQIVPDADTLPPFLKTAARLTEDQVGALPDDSFALVLLDGGHKMKKYATVDKGNTALSVLYLLKQAHLLPKEAVKVAAKNLISACEAHGLEVPAKLKVAAMAGFLGKSQSPYAKGATPITLNSKIAPGEYADNPQLGGSNPNNEQDVVDRTNMNGPGGSNFIELPQFAQKEKQLPYPYADGSIEKRAEDARFFSPEVLSALGIDERGWSTSLHKQETRMRPGMTREVRHVDVSDWSPEEQLPENQPSSNTLLGTQYPVDSMEQIKTASEYVVENFDSFHPADRHTYCVKLAARMRQMRMEVPENIEKLGSETYDAEVDAYVSYRRSLVLEPLKPAVDVLLEKRAMMSPETFVKALADFDKLAGLNYSWGSQVPDPWYSTFGPSLEKRAEKDWSWTSNGAYVNEYQLERLANNGHTLICKHFGREFAEAFQKDPKGAFLKLSPTLKLYLARAASDRHAGTATE